MTDSPTLQPEAVMTPHDEATPVQRAGMRAAIFTQCFGALGDLALTNGMILLYLNALGIVSARIVAYLAIPYLGGALFRLPLAYMADRYGKKRFGFIGTLFLTVGMIIMLLAGLPEGPLREACVLIAVVCYGLGFAFYGSTWFALLSPIVPPRQRGRFFGKLRTAWQLVGVIFALIVANFLSRQSPVWVFQLIIASLVAALMIRIVFYLKLPELEHSPPAGTLINSLLKVVRNPGYLSFCAYVFLLMVFTGGCPAIFGLIAKNVLGLGDDHVLWLGVLLMIGSIVGFYLGGKSVDRWGTKPAFLICHTGYALLLTAILSRDAFPAGPFVAVALAFFVYGMMFAWSSIAISTEMLALVPAENKSLSTSMCQAMYLGGASLSGLLASVILKMNIIAEQWTLWERSMTRYDAVLLLFAMMVVLLVVTLGLVPSVVHKAEWVPRQF